eukprot:GHRR01031193.1.p1 GENE.GHRR01031193.1~~GHRR01031193.1.p1  ORF type:complete len:149 (+),score=60.26 GHRR01031193.1:311-757(+)
MKPKQHVLCSSSSCSELLRPQQHGCCPPAGFDPDQEDDEVQLREQHAGFRMSATQRLQRQTSKGPGTAAAAAAAANSKKVRRRWIDGSRDGFYIDADVASDLIPAGRPDIGNTGHIVRMRRGEAWSKFLAYEGCCQVRLAAQGSRAAY